MGRISPGVTRVGLIVVVLIAWELFARLGGVSHILIAPPSEVVAQGYALFASAGTDTAFYSNIWITIEELLVAYAIAAGGGLALGFAFASSKAIGDAFEPILLVLYAIPKIILYPLILLMLGIGILPKIVFGVMVGIFVIVFNTAAGIRQVEPNYIRLARSLGYSPTLIFFKTILPAAAPTIMAGLRLGFGYTIIGIMAAELLVVNAGIGFLIDRASFNYHTAQLYALIIITLGIGAVGNSLFGLIERRWAR
jgi:NitT/TauT family transport system permease protein